MSILQWLKGLYRPQKHYYNNGKEILTMGNTENMEEPSTEIQAIQPPPRVYYAFTEAKRTFNIGALGVSPEDILATDDTIEIRVNGTNKPFITNNTKQRATIALRVKNFDSFTNIVDIEYGVAICSDDDNFSRRKGMEVALERLNNHFGKATTKILKPSDTITSVAKDLLYSISDAVSDNIHKYQVRLHKHSENIKEGNPEFGWLRPLRIESGIK